MLIAEEYLLLALDERTGKLRIGSDALGPALGGALVAELALRERIGVTPHEAGWNKRGRVTIISTMPTDDPELDAALQKLLDGAGLSEVKVAVGARRTGDPFTVLIASGTKSGRRPKADTRKDQ